MGKVKFIVLGIVLCFVTLPVSAQFRYGAKAGVSINSVHFNKNKLDPESAFGYHVGPMMEWMFPLNLGFDFAVLFSQKGLEYHNKRYTQHYLDMPLNLKWKVNVPFGKAYLAAGPYLAIAVGDKDWSIPKASSASGSGNMKVNTRSKDVGVNFGAGVDFLKYFQVGVNYRYGLADAYEVKSSGTTNAQNHGFEISLGVLF